MTNKRFVYYPFSRAITDRKTKWDYEGNKETTNLLNQLHTENLRLKQTIKEAYQTERTSLGKSVLKQLIEQME